MIMNMKLTATFAALVAATGMSAFGQGYVIFDTTKGNVYDDFTTPGTSVASSGTVTATFLWAATGTADPLGAGLATGATSAAGGWASIESMLSSGWTIANNAGTSAEADVTTGVANTTKGNLAYNGGSNFALTGSVGGTSYEFVVIGWAATAGGSLGAAEGNGAVGWSSAFTYATGAGSLATPDTFSVAGETPFGVAPVGATPEPTSLALAGLGGLSMLFLRRRKS